MKTLNYVIKRPKERSIIWHDLKPPFFTEIFQGIFFVHKMYTDANFAFLNRWDL